MACSLAGGGLSASNSRTRAKKAAARRGSSRRALAAVAARASHRGMCGLLMASQFQPGAPLARSIVAFPAADFERQVAGRLAPLGLETSDDGGAARDAGLPEQLDGNISVAHGGGGSHQGGELAADLFPIAVGIERREGAEAAAQTPNGNAQIVDGIGIGVALGAVQLE